MSLAPILDLPIPAHWRSAVAGECPNDSPCRESADSPGRDSLHPSGNGHDGLASAPPARTRGNGSHPDLGRWTGIGSTLGIDGDTATSGRPYQPAITAIRDCAAGCHLPLIPSRQNRGCGCITAAERASIRCPRRLRFSSRADDCPPPSLTTQLQPVGYRTAEQQGFRAPARPCHPKAQAVETPECRVSRPRYHRLRILARAGYHLDRSNPRASSRVRLRFSLDGIGLRQPLSRAHRIDGRRNSCLQEAPQPE